MNFLAHAWLAGDADADRIGGLLGDFVKGPLPAGLPPALADGVALHRAIDGYAATSGMSPPDLPTNYGGRFYDIGFGINTVIPSGVLAGHRLSAEWLQPLRDDVNGYQQKRDGTLTLNWSKAF